jgi:hypothetical protein
MDRLRTTRQPAAAGVKPGTLRLQTQNLVVLAAALEKLEPQTREQLLSLTRVLVKAGQQDAAGVNAAADALLEYLKGREAFAQRQFSRTDAVDVRKTLLRTATTDQAGDYAVAEQIVLGVESLSYFIGDRNSKKTQLDKLYAAVKDGTRFNPLQFSAAAKSVAGAF